MKVDDGPLFYRQGSVPLWPHEQPFLLPYLHLHLRPRFTLYVGIINQDPRRRPGAAYDMYGLTVGHDLCSDCRGLWLYWGQWRRGFFVRPVQR